MVESMPSLPLAVTVGFSGPRNWFPKADHPDIDPADFQAAATAWLKDRLAALPAELGLGSGHFLTGISQIAIGGDHAFTTACMELGIPQIISLPQPSDAYLDARGSTSPDFSEEEKQRSLALLASPHIIQEKVVSHSPDRHTRFEEANVELVRGSDILIAMVKPDVAGKRGGTWDVIDQAARWNTPVLIVTVSLVNGVSAFQAEWEKTNAPLKSCFNPPAQPSILDNAELSALTPAPVPAKDNYFKIIKDHCSQGAGDLRKKFQYAAIVIIGTHFLATVCAVAALALLKESISENVYYPAVIAFLFTELILLGGGYLYHGKLHDSKAALNWALHRLLAEVARSVIAFGKYHTGFAHLRVLDLPSGLRPLLRTMEILQLRETRAVTCDQWQTCRDTYITARLEGEKGQLNFYSSKARKAEFYLHFARQTFKWASILAIAATAVKLVTIFAYKLELTHDIDLEKAALGVFRILLHVVAVAALSLAAANDLEARSHTFSETHDFLTRQAELLKTAKSEREFSNLLTETESRLLGETVTWFSRRSFTGVA